MMPEKGGQSTGPTTFWLLGQTRLSRLAHLVWPCHNARPVPARPRHLRHDTRGRSAAGVFLHPIQPLAYEGLAESCLFETHKMSGPIEHRERRSGVGVQQIPGVLVSTEVVLSCGQNERRATKEGKLWVHFEGSGAGHLQSLVEGVVRLRTLREHVAE